jgi:MFS family permease
MIGPSYIFSSILPNKLGVIITGLCITGFGGAFTSIGCY